MTERDASGDDLFRITYDGGTQRVGVPATPGTAQVTLHLSPHQLVRLVHELTSAAIEGLALSLEYGELLLDPIRKEIQGWGREWLQTHGMQAYRAQVAAKELVVKGYIRKEILKGRPNAPHMGVLLGSRFGWGSPEVGALRTELRPTKPTISGAQASVPSADSGDAERYEAVGNAAEASERESIRRPGAPVDNPDEASDGVSIRRPEGAVDNSEGPSERESVRRDVVQTLSVRTDDVNPQVTGGEGPSGVALSTSPPRCKEVGGSPLPSLWKPKGKIATTTLETFLAAPAVWAALASDWESSVEALAAVIDKQPVEHVEAMLLFLGVDGGLYPSLRLAGVVVDHLSVPDAVLATKADLLIASLKDRSVVAPSIPYRSLTIRYSLTILTSLSNSIRQPAGFVYKTLRNDEYLSTIPLRTALDVIERLTYGTPTSVAPIAAPLATFTAPTSTPGPQASDVARNDINVLRAAVIGTAWEDDISFANLLRNTSAQRKLLIAYHNKNQRATG